MIRTLKPRCLDKLRAQKLQEAEWEWLMDWEGKGSLRRDFIQKLTNPEWRALLLENSPRSFFDKIMWFPKTDKFWKYFCERGCR
jgi:hypothetical protein